MKWTRTTYERARRLYRLTMALGPYRVGSLPWLAQEYDRLLDRIYQRQDPLTIPLGTWPRIPRDPEIPF